MNQSINRSIFPDCLSLGEHVIRELSAFGENLPRCEGIGVEGSSRRRRCISPVVSAPFHGQAEMARPGKCLLINNRKGRERERDRQIDSELTAIAIVTMCVGVSLSFMTFEKDYRCS